MCGLCGLLGVDHWTEISAHDDVFAGEVSPTVRSERIERTKLINALLQPWRITVGDFQASSYVVSSPTGRRLIVQDLQAVWAAVEQLSGRSVDPLDNRYIRHLLQSAS